MKKSLIGNSLMFLAAILMGIGLCIGVGGWFISFIICIFFNFGFMSCPIPITMQAGLFWFGIYSVALGGGLFVLEFIARVIRQLRKNKEQAWEQWIKPIAILYLLVITSVAGLLIYRSSSSP
jgi:hypothetical protein